MPSNFQANYESKMTFTKKIEVYLLALFISIGPANAESHHPQEFLKTIQGSKNEGKLIYNQFCINCHAKKPLINLGAPRIGDEGDWKLRLNQEIGVLFNHTDEGMNGMPPRGGCFECTDEQLILSIVEMLPDRVKNEVLNKLRAYKKSR